MVRTLERLAENLPAFDAEAVLLTPAGFRSIPLPTYPDIRLALTTPWRIRRSTISPLPTSSAASCM